ncbi:hypothetical protein HPB50_018658 [Hyalomma asiaticum]|uniref:Uncharacterized protein n=1 Tax=Hyalomma asiaticum TaxID=266040 RepID=A0ACB7SL74_HYAAI|nr:hypothetical protein HPB50_018658 [Hyalomma asiaticum]
MITLMAAAPVKRCPETMTLTDDDSVNHRASRQQRHHSNNRASVSLACQYIALPRATAIALVRPNRHAA